MNLIPATSAPCDDVSDWLMPDDDRGVRVHRTAMVDQTTYIAAGATIKPWAVIGGRAIIEAGAVIRAGARIGDRTIIGAGAVIKAGAIIGAGAVIGAAARIAAASRIEYTEDHLIIGPLGTRYGVLTLHRDEAIGVRIIAGCWSGSLDEFMARLTDAPEHDEYRKIVPAAHDLLVARMARVRATKNEKKGE